MNLSSLRAVGPLPPGARGRADRLVWLLLALPVIQTLLFWTIPDLTVAWAGPVRALRPLATFGAGVLFLIAAAHERHTRRWAWVCFAVMQGIHTLGSALAFVLPALSLAADYGYGSLVQAISLAMYGAGLLGAGLYLQQQDRWIGAAARVVLDAATVALALVVLLDHLLPVGLRVTALPPPLYNALPYLAADVGGLFALLTVAWRSGQQHQTLISLTALGFGCLLLADAIDVVVTLIPSLQPFRFATSPLYILQGVLMAVGAYWSVRQPAPPPQAEQVSPAAWWLWTLTPVGLATSALTFAAFTGTRSPWLVAALWGVALAQITLMIQTLRRTQLLLAAETRRAQQTRGVVRFYEHELRNYAEGIRGLAQLLEHQLRQPAPEPAPTLRTVATLGRTADQTRDLVQELLLLSRHGDPLAIQREPVPLHALARDVLATTILPDRGIRQQVAVDPALVVRGDPLLLRLALRTAVRNAVDALERSGGEVTPEIAIHADADARTICLCVEDTGPGLPATVRAAHAAGQLFALHDVSNARGRGLGLALLDQIARLHGGRLTLGNHAERPGAWVKLELPRWTDAEDGPSAAS